MFLSQGLDLSDIAIKITGLILLFPLFWTFWFIPQKESPHDGDANLKLPSGQNKSKRVLFIILRWLYDRLESAPSSASYSFHFGLMLFYVIGGFSIFWAMGGNGRLGSFQILSDALPLWQRWLALLVLTAFTVGIFRHKLIDSVVQKGALGKISENYSYWGYRFVIAASMAGYSVWNHEYSVLPFSVVALYSPVLAVIFIISATFSIEITIAFAVAIALAVIIAIAFPGSRMPRRRGRFQKKVRLHIQRLIFKLVNNERLLALEESIPNYFRKTNQKFSRKLNRRVNRGRRSIEQLSRKVNNRLSRYFSVG